MDSACNSSSEYPASCGSGGSSNDNAGKASLPLCIEANIFDCFSRSRRLLSLITNSGATFGFIFGAILTRSLNSLTASCLTTLAIAPISRSCFCSRRSLIASIAAKILAPTPSIKSNQDRPEKIVTPVKNKVTISSVLPIYPNKPTNDPFNQSPKKPPATKGLVAAK